MEVMKYPAIVDTHLPGGFTKLRISISGGLYFDVPTEAIPIHLRNIGAKVVLCLDGSIRPSSLEEARTLRSEAVRVEDPASPKDQG